MKPTKLKPRKSRAPLSRSEVMSRIRGRDTKPELAVRAAVNALGHRYRLGVSDLPGKPDLANRSRKWAIFVHGCFWHGHGCNRASNPKTNTDYWTPKLRKNRDRDARNAESLTKMGLRVLTVWECEAADPGTLTRILHGFFDNRQQAV